MTRLLFLAPLLGLTTMSVAAGAAPAPGGRCSTARLAPFVGRPWVRPTTMSAVHDSGAGITRVVRPGEQMTMDLRTDRLNVFLNGRNRVIRFTCG